MTIATTEPSQLYAGDTWEWIREDIPDFPAPTWLLKYRFKSEVGGFEIVSTASGANHAVSVLAADTAKFKAGRYTWQARLFNGALSHTNKTGLLVVLADLYSGTAALLRDLRSSARKMFDAVEALMQNRATYEQKTMTWGDRTLERFSPAELLTLYDRLKMDVQREESAANATATGVSPNRYYVRMGRG